MRCFVASTVFAGKANGVVESRVKQWEAWWLNGGLGRMTEKVGGRISQYAYGPGDSVPLDRGEQDGVSIVVPRAEDALVAKGLVVRLDLLIVLNQVDREEIDRSEAIYAFIDGSGAFDFDNLLLLFGALSDKNVDLVLGLRPEGNSGMVPYRKAIEDFEQFLLFKFRRDQMLRSFDVPDFESDTLPDGQAGCWAFRLSAASKLALTARGFELELDILLSALDAGLRIGYTPVLRMGSAPRVSVAGGGQIGANPAAGAFQNTESMHENTKKMCVQKLRFLKQKLALDHRQVWGAWQDFEAKFSETKARAILPAYRELLRAFCAGSGR